MRRSLTLHVPDKVFERLDSEAQAAGQSIQDVAVEVLRSRISVAPQYHNGSGTAPQGLARLLHACGRVAVSDPSGAENELVDRDLARESESTHEA